MPNSAINKVTIYGERCSGTNYLAQLLNVNFEVELIWDFGWKHFFGFADLTHSQDVLFLGIIRNPLDWLSSFFVDQHHLPTYFRNNLTAFLTHEIHSYWLHGEGMRDRNMEEMHDRNMLTGERYRNIFELRNVKNKFLMETMPNLVKHYKLIMYEDLLTDFDSTMHSIKNMGLVAKQGFPVNTHQYKHRPDLVFTGETKPRIVTKDQIAHLLTSEPRDYQ